MNDWLSRVPPQERRALAGRLRRPDDHTFQAAFLELYLHESLIRSGLDLEIEPALPGTDRRPDFLARSSGESFYLEARSPSTSRTRQGTAGRISDVYDGLNKTDSPNFWLAIDINAAGERALSTKPLRAQLEAWLKGLDPDDLITREEWPPFSWDREDWSITLRALPKSPSMRGSDTGLRPLAIYGSGGEAQWVDDAGVLTDALSDKGNAYGRPEHGFMVAIGTSFFSDDDFGVKNALYGPEQWVIDPVEGRFLGAARGPGGYFHAGDGHWAHQHVSGVLIVNNLHPGAFTKQTPTYWPNPRATHEVTVPEAWDVVALVDGHLKRTPATLSQHELFHLPEPGRPARDSPSSVVPWRTRLGQCSTPSRSFAATKNGYNVFQRDRFDRFVAEQYAAGRSLREVGELTGRTQTAVRRSEATQV